MFPVSRVRHTAVVLALLVLDGCSLSPVPKPTDPSGITQQLMIRSLERALGRLSIERLKEQTITIEIFSQVGPTVPTVLIREFVTTWLRAHGVRIVDGLPDLKVKAFASVLGTDSDQDLFGIPAFQAPIVNVPVPEIAFFKWQRNRGVAEIRLFEFDAKTEEFIAAPPIAVGRARLDKYTILIFFGYTQTDVDDHE
jgi:hypothetical protein